MKLDHYLSLPLLIFLESPPNGLDKKQYQKEKNHDAEDIHHRDHSFGVELFVGGSGRPLIGTI